MNTPHTKRTILLATAAVAGLTGAGFAWFQHRPRDIQESSSSAVWALEASTPTGNTLKLADFRGKPLILNFWATWCPPCVEELPLLSEFHQTHQKSWHVVALAADQAASVAKFIQHTPLSMPTAVLGMDGIELSRQLGNERGGLPFTVVFDRHGNVAQRKIGQISASDLDQWLKEAL